MTKTILFVGLLIVYQFAAAAWDNVENNQKVAYLDGAQYNQCVVPDNEGGCFVVWQDTRLADNLDQIVAQHFDSLGNPSWQENGIYLAPTANVQRYVQAFGDGNGGLITLWADHRDSIGPTSRNVDLWGQRVDKSGTLQWGNLGKLLVGEKGEQNIPLTISNGKDGFILAWKDGGDVPSGRQSGYWMQRFDVAGNEQWTKGGHMIHQVSNVFSSSRQWTMCSDGTNGAILIFTESGVNTEQASNIYGHRVDATGTRYWKPDIDTIAGSFFIERGFPINKGKGNDNFPIVELGEDGFVYISWQGKRETSWQHGALFAQKITVNGDFLWAKEGVQISTTSLDASNQFDMLLDHNGGIFFNYIVDKSNRRDLIRFDTAGKKSWVSPVTINDDMIAISRMKRVHQNKMYVAWIETERNQNSENAIVVQWFDTLGNKLLEGNAVISTYPEDKASIVIETGLNDELFCVWGDYRRTNGQSSSNADVDLFIQRFVSSKTAGIQNNITQSGYFWVIDSETSIQFITNNLRSEIGQLYVIDMMGKTCVSTAAVSLNQSVEIEASSMASGIYTAILQTKNGTHTLKFYHR